MGIWELESCEVNPAHEEDANWFAGAILIPRDALLDLVKRGAENQAAAKHFGVSVSLLTMRKNLTGEAPGPLDMREYNRELKKVFSQIRRHRASSH
jgi:Zn-dependent peptidase ImmA (M78 family)